ncbi:unnamed protein product [Coregonus sp. 'balchen']|nr:unnamed protein product [Coregonus sp. 'balchen']
MTMDTAVASSKQEGSFDDSLSDEEPSQSESNSPTAVLTQVSGTGDSAGMTVVQLPGGQTVHVQGVIQAPQASVIQSPQMQNVQITSIAGLEDGESAIASPGSEGLQGLQTLAMSNSGTPQILQYATQAGDSGQQFFSVQAATGDMPAYQLRSPTSSGLPQGLVMAASPGSLEAARECRKKKKEYVKCLEHRVAVLENQNKTLIEELKALKDIYCHKNE